jgi:hypothetical protein
MLDNNHLHIDHSDQLSDLLSKSLRSIVGGTVTIAFANESAARIVVDSDNIAVDLLQPDFFRISQDETGLFDKLKTATEFGRKLADNEMTISVLRKGKEAIRIGKDAKPTFSKLITRSSDLQLTSIREAAKLKGDFKTD